MNRSKNLPFRLLLLLAVPIVGIIASSQDSEAAQRYCPVQYAVSCEHCQMICAHASCEMIDCLPMPDWWWYCGCA